MKRKYLLIGIAGLLLIFFASFIEEGSNHSVKNYISPISIVPDPDGEILYIADFTGQQVIVFNVEDQHILEEIPLEGSPTGLCISDEGMLYVTCGIAPGWVNSIDLSNYSVQKPFRVGHSPVAPVLSADGKFLFVSDQFMHRVLKLDLTDGLVKASIPVTREPSAAIIDPSGEHLFVANHLPGGSANLDFVSCNVSVIDLKVDRLIKQIELPNGSNSLKGITFSPDGKHLYISHIIAGNLLPTTHMGRGWMNTNVVSILDAEGLCLESTVILDNIDKGAANPWDLICSRDGKYLCVAISGTNEVILIDREQMHARLNHTDDTFVGSDLAFLEGLRHRIKLHGIGPRGLAISNNKLFVSEFYSASVTEIDLAIPVPSVSRSANLGLAVEPDQRRLGEIYFHDATNSFQMWQSCASCHPGDGRVDGLNWDLLNDGFGNPKNTKSLLLSHQTPPAMITGIRPDAETGVRSGFKFIEFAHRPEKDAQAIDAYLRSLQPLSSPMLEEGALSDAALKGQKLFRRAGCAICHRGPHFTNKKSYSVGTGTGLDENRKFDTPTLVELWRTGPYLYDGRAKTIEEVITLYNPENNHGKTKNLTPEEIDFLTAYLLSI